MSDCLWSHGLYSPWKSLGQNTGVGSHSLLQEIFPTQGSNPGLPHHRQILYQLSHQGNLKILEEEAYPIPSISSWCRNQTAISCIAGGFFTTMHVNSHHPTGQSICFLLLHWHVKQSESHSVMSNSLQPLWNSPGQYIGVGNLSLLQGIFPTQGSNPTQVSPHCRQILYPLSRREAQFLILNPCLLNQWKCVLFTCSWIPTDKS